MLTTLSRVLKSGWLGFWRNKWLSVAASGMMSLAIFTVSGLLLVNVMIDSLISNLENKIDISVYFNQDAPEDKILDARSDLVKLSEVKSVDYISKEEASNRFKDKHKNNLVLIQSLNELDNNPFEPSLNIKAQISSQYESIANFLEQEKYRSLIHKINYKENQPVINRLSSITSAIRKFGFGVLLFFVFLAILVTFNTIRLTIYSAQKQIKVMKLVGASNWFVRGPFIIEGAMYGIVAAVFVLIILYPLLWYLSPKIAVYLPGTDIFYYFRNNLFSFFLIQLLTGIVLGSISSLVAVRRYLDV